MGWVLLVGLYAGALVGCSSADEKVEKNAGAAKPDYRAASRAITELSDAYGQVAQADVAAQQAAVDYVKAHPDGSLDDAAITSSQEKLTEAFAKRDELRDGLADLSALKDPEVKKAYDAFITRAREQDAFNDGYYTAFPAYRASLTRCLDVFQVTADGAPKTNSATVYGAQLLRRHDAAAPDCTEVLTELSHSKVAMMKAYATGSLDTVRQRRALLSGLAKGELGTDAALRRFQSTSKDFQKNLDRNTRFDQELARLNARDEFAAFQRAVESKRKAG